MFTYNLLNLSVFQTIVVSLYAKLENVNIERLYRKMVYFNSCDVLVTQCYIGNYIVMRPRSVPFILELNDQKFDNA